MQVAPRERRMKQDPASFGKKQELYVGLVRLHVLHHAAEEPILAWE